MYFIYILYSQKLDRYYVGTTDDVDKRLVEHNSGLYSNSFTSKGIPWNLRLCFECDSSTTAYDLERFLKRMKSRVFLEKVIVDPGILLDIQNKLQDLRVQLRSFGAALSTKLLRLKGLFL